MSAPSGINKGVGFRHVVLFPLNADGLPDAASTTFAEGLELDAPKSLTISEPGPRIISHTGRDRLIQQDSLPATEGMTVTLRVGGSEDAVDAAVSGLKVFTQGERNMIGGGVTDLSGEEPKLGLLAWRQAEQADGSRSRQFRIFPSATFVKKDGPLDDNSEEREYTVIPAICTKHLWGTAFSDATEGATSMQVVRGTAVGKPKIVYAVGDGVEDEFLFPADKQATSTAKITVYVDGVEKTTNITKATTGITFSASYEPADGALIVVFYEY